MSLVQATIKLNISGANTKSHFCRQVYESFLNVMRLVDGHVIFFFNIFFSALLREKLLRVSWSPECAKVCLKLLCQEDITVLG